MRLPALLAILLLAGCGYYDARAARDPLTSLLIGMGFPDLVHCMGPWDSWHQIDRDVFDVTWGHTDSSAALKMSIAVLGSIPVGRAAEYDVAVYLTAGGPASDSRKK